MVYKSKIIFLILVFGLFMLLLACEDESKPNKNVTMNTVSGTISQPISPKKSKKEALKKHSDSKEASKAVEQIKTSEVKIKDQLAKSESKEKLDIIPAEHYDFQGKIDPFKPLIQDQSHETASVGDDRPKRVLTPLEKIELSQIRLVAVIIMENERIAMVEEASGKGYEVRIGTYMGKNQGKVFEIKKSSIVVKELIRDYKGRLKERVQEIKLYQMDGEG